MSKTALLVQDRVSRIASVREASCDNDDGAQLMIDCMGDAVLSTDAGGHVTYINAVAEDLMGWSRKEAHGRPLSDVFQIIDGDSRETAPDPIRMAIRENKTVSLTPNCILIRRDGVEVAVEDSVAPIRNRQGTVTGAVMIFRDVTAARAMSLKMSHLAQHDGLTDLPNRLLLHDRLTQAMAMANRTGKKLAVLYLDIDQFKSINDSAGHAIGDRLLQSIAQRLLSSVRHCDTVSRRGGDEFAILLCEVAHAYDAAVAADKLLVSLRGPHFVDELELYVSASIGIVTYPQDGSTADDLLTKADAAMYHAKDCGGNNYQFFKAATNVAVRPSAPGLRRVAHS
jgi:diguanylate cyclase (GGDEF)-like protein/PAS domain S-box-containing protein